MLLLGTEQIASQVVVLRDHADPATYHYLPAPPHIVVQQDRVGMHLLRYRGGAEGGFLTLDVESSFEEAALAAAAQELGTRTGLEVNLVPVLFDEGSVRLAVLGVESAGSEPSGPAPGGPTDSSLGATLVEQILATATPSLLGSARAIFSVSVGPEAAALLASAIRSEGPPVLVVYDLVLSGLRPARGLRARVDHGMAYRYLRSRFRANALVFAGDVDREAEAMRREGIIQIEDVDYQGVDPQILARREEETRTTLRELAQDLFLRPATSPAALGAEHLSRAGPVEAAWGASGHLRSAFVLRDLDQEEDQILTYDLTETAVARMRVAPQAVLSVPPGADPSSLVTDVALEEVNQPLEVHVLAPADADWRGVAAVQFDMTAGDEVRSVVLSAAEPSGTAVLPAGDASFRLRVMSEPEPDALGQGPVSDPAFHPLPARTMVIDPQAAAGRRELEVTLGAVDREAVRAVRGRLIAAEAEVGVFLDQQHPSVRIPVWGSSNLRFEATLVTTDGGELPVGWDVGAGERVVVVNQPADRFRMVALILQDPLDRLEAVTVELEAAAGADRRAVSLTAATSTGRWSAPRQGEAVSYRYRVQAIGRDGHLEESDWQEGVGGLLVVGDVDLRVDRIEVVLAGLPTETVGALIVLTSLDPPEGVAPGVETLVDAGQTRFSVGLPFRRDAPRRYRVEGEVFLLDGQLILPPTEETAEVLVMRPPSQ